MRAPGRGRRHRDDGIAAIGPAHRLALDGAIIGEVGHCHPPARRLNRGDDLLRHRPRVEARRAIRGDRLKRRREVVERDVIAGPFHASVGPEKHAGRRRMAGERFGRQGERIGDVVVDGETSASERDRRGDELGERELAGAVFAPGELEAGDRAGDADRKAGIARLERIGLAVGVEEHVLGRRRGRGLAVVDRDRLITISAMNQHEPAAADIAGARQGDGERKADRDCRIDGIAASLQDIEPDSRRLRLLSYNHAMSGDDRSRGGERGNDRRRVGADGLRSKAEEGEGGEAKRSQGYVVPAAAVIARSEATWRSRATASALEPLARFGSRSR